MAVDNPGVIDFASIDPEVLTIADHLDWADELNHLYLLQNKINAYLASIDGDGLIENYPGQRP